MALILSTCQSICFGRKRAPASRIIDSSLALETSACVRGIPHVTECSKQK